MNWTCCECENKYDNSTGDVDERMCNECLDGVPDLEYSEMEKIMLKNWFEEYSEIFSKILTILKKRTIDDLRTIFDALSEMGYKEAS